MNPIQNMLAPAGPVAGWMEWLWWVFFWMSVVVYVATLAPLLFWLWRSRRIETDRPVNFRRKLRVVSWAVAVTAITLLGLTAVSAAVGRRVSDLHAYDGDPLYVTAHQWWWEVVYPNPEPALTVTSANEIHIPAGRKIKIELRSDDVIHSFWVPNLAGKRDLIPGRVNLTWIQADQPGVFVGRCAEYCGYQHAHMGFVVVAHPPDEFQKWITNERRLAVEPTEEPAARGKLVFQSQACILCHAIRGTLAFGSAGPDLTHVGSRTTIAAATLETNRQNLREWVRDSHQFKPGVRMPPIDLAREDLEALAAYLEALK